MMRIFRRAVFPLLLALLTAACERSPVEPPLEVRIDSPAPGAAIASRSATVAGLVVNATAPTVSFAVNDGPFMAAGMSSEVPNGFEIALADLALGTTKVTVRATDGGRAASKAVTFDVVLPQVIITLDTPAPSAALPYRTWAFSGQVSAPGAAVRYSVNGGTERGVQQYPPMASTGGVSTFRGEAHTLADGVNTVEFRAYLNGDLVGTRSATVSVDVVGRRYDVASVIEIDGGKSYSEIRLGIDGRIAGYWTGADDTTRVFTWAAGSVVQLTGMRSLHDVNNVGQVLGVETGTTTAILWKDGVYTPVTEFPHASLINDHGHLGRTLMPGYWNGTQFVAYPQQGMVTVASMNNHGAMAGSYYSTNGAHPAPVVWLGAQQPQQTFSLGALYRYGSAHRIGDGGHVLLGGTTSSTSPEFIGSRALLWHSGTLTDLSSRVGLQTAAVDVNASGVVAGHYLRDGLAAAFTWQDGRMVDVVVNSMEWVITRVFAIDDSGRLAVEGKRAGTGRVAVLVLTPAG